MPAPDPRTTPKRRKGSFCLGSARRGAAPMIGALLLAAAAGAACAGELDPALAALAQVAPRSVSAVVLELEGAKPVAEYAAQLAGLPRGQRPGRLAELMRKDFEAAAALVLGDVHAAGAFGVQPLWIAHSLAFSVSRNKLAALAELPGVRRIDSDASLRSVAPRHALGPTGAAARRAREAASEPRAGTARRAPAVPSALEALAQGTALNWPVHFAALDVPGAWQRGQTGEGVTVAVVDSGVDLREASIAMAYRGRAADWFDPYAQQRFPVDTSGHGTLVAGILVGGVVDGTPIGVAPRARWIAARLFDDAGQGRESAVQRIYQWVLDPDGDPTSADAPDIVNNSWGLPQSTGQCNPTFARAVAALRAADIHVVFAAGNDGPEANTSMSPANLPGVLAVGALDAQRNVAERSSRGPSACGGGIFPRVYAPGVNLPALDRVAASTGSAALADGTSFAAAAVSGALAILRGAARDADSASVESALVQAAQRVAGNAAPVPTPDLSAALDALRVAPIDAASTQPIVLRWAPQAPAGAELEITAQTLNALLPWSLSIDSIRPLGAPSSGRLEALGGAWARLFGTVSEWSYRVDAANPAPLRFDVQASRGRSFIVELTPRTPDPATGLPRQRQVLQALANRSVQIELDTETSGANEQRVHVTTPVRGGRVKRIDDRRLEYTPPADWVGTDQFTVSLRDAGGANQRVTTVAVRVVRQ